MVGDASATALEIDSFFRERHMRPVLDLDSISEIQGMGRELRRLGITPVCGDTHWMRYPAEEIKSQDYPHIEVMRIPSQQESDELSLWVQTALCEDIGTPEEDVWRQVLIRESSRRESTLFLAILDGEPVGACSLFSYENWGRIDSVVTLPAFRRRRVASALVAEAVYESLKFGNTVTYLCTESGGAAESLYIELGFESWGVNILRRHMG